MKSVSLRNINCSHNESKSKHLLKLKYKSKGKYSTLHKQKELPKIISPSLRETVSSLYQANGGNVLGLNKIIVESESKMTALRKSRNKNEIDDQNI